MSSKGSINNPAGGRFNIGNIDRKIFPPFGAIYLANDRETAIREKHGLPKNFSSQSGLSFEELTLTQQSSETVVVVSGILNCTLDLTNKNNLARFLKHISSIKLPAIMRNEAKNLGIDPMVEAKTLSELNRSIFYPQWRKFPYRLNVPSSSQILGQIAYEAGIETILYPSTKDKKLCLAIFPKNICFFILNSLFPIT